MNKRIKLTFDKKTKRPKTVSVRLTEDSAVKLDRLAKKFGVSQADIIEKLISLAD